MYLISGFSHIKWAEKYMKRTEKNKMHIAKESLLENTEHEL